MVGFDHITCLSVAALDDIRVDCPLCQIADFSLEFPCFSSENSRKFLSYNLSLGLGVGLADQAAIESLLGVDADKVQVKTALRPEDSFHLVALIFSHEAVVHKDTVQLTADCPGEEGCSDRGIHASGEAQQNMPVSDFFAEFLNRALCKGGHLPVTFAAADIHDKIPEHFCPFLSMYYFRVELDSIEPAGGILHSCHRAVLRMGRDREPFRDFRNIVGVAHPADRGCFPVTFDIFQKQGRLFVYIDFRASVFADRGGFDLSPAAVCHELRSIADAQDRDPHLKKLRGAGG